MERTMDNDNARETERAWNLMKKIGFAMFVTRDGDRIRARPMSAYVEQSEGAIYFLTDARRHKDEYDENGADDGFPVFGDGRDLVLQLPIDERADHRAHERIDASQQ